MSSSLPNTPASAVAIGASVGAVQALLEILPKLPADYPLPVLVVVHLPRRDKSGLAELFASRCLLQVKEAEDKEPVRAGTIYFAPPDYHLLLEAKHRISLSSDEPVLFSRPSIDVLLTSAADAYGSGLTAIVLTGANSDGASGLAAVCKAGGTAWVQDPETAECPLMPQAALAACPTARTMRLDEIAQTLLILP
jgi:two-component system, chemotaxis family, protein-glutamate methylesterase/glutaminase